MGFGDQNFDERPHAKNIAQALELPWQSGLATADDIRKKLVEIPQTFDEPFADSSAAPTMLVAALARQQFKVVLSGDGGDELFLGYNRYRLFSLAERAARAPAGVRRAASEIAARLPSQLVDRLYHGARRLGHLPQIQHPSRKLLAVTQTLVEDDRIALYADTLRISGRRVLSHIYGNSEAIALSALRRAALKAPEAPAQLFASAIDEETYLPEDILTKVDRSTMAVGLEARVPLLDPRVRSVARATSARLHCQQGGKNVLRSALNQVLPAHLTSRPKQGFSIPLASWLRGPLLQEMQGCASDSRLGDLGLSLREIDILGQEHSSGKADHGNALWALMCLRSYLARVDGP